MIADHKNSLQDYEVSTECRERAPLSREVYHTNNKGLCVGGRVCSFCGLENAENIYHSKPRILECAPSNVIYSVLSPTRSVGSLSGEFSRQ